MLSKENKIKKVDDKMRELKELRASLAENEVLLTEEFNEDPAAFYNDYAKVDMMNNLLQQIEKCDKDIARLEKMKAKLIEKKIKRHLGMDIEEYFSVIHKYLKEQENINEDVLNKAQAIEKFLKESIYPNILDKDNLLGVLVYGSSLTGFSSKNSDIDLLIILNEAEETIRGV